MPSEQFTNIVQLFKTQRAAAPATPPTFAELRAGFELLGQMMPPVAGVEITDFDLAGMKAARFTPENAANDRTILYLHGGGYVMGSKSSHTPLVANLAKASGIEVVFPEYRLGPEDPYPAAVDDALSAYRWLIDRGVAPEHLVVAGESAGGGLTLALLVALRDAGDPLPAAAVAISPWCDLTGLGDVTPEALDTDILTPETVAIFADGYAAVAQRTEPLCSPVLADLRGLPPLLVQAGECEIFCSQDRELASRAKDAGVDVTLDVEPGMFHAIPLFAGALPEADEAIARIASFVRNYTS